MLKKLIRNNEHESTHCLVEINALFTSKDEIFNNIVSSLEVNNGPINFFSSFKLIPEIELNSNRPSINVSIGNEQFKGLIDTGASLCIFGFELKFLWDKFFHIQCHRYIDFRVANGTLLEQNETKLIPILYDNETKFIECAFAKNVIIPLVLGVNFLHRFGFGFYKLSNSNKLSDQINDLSSIDSTEEIYVLNKNQQTDLENVVNLFLFNDNDRIGCQSLITHHINTGECLPLVQHQYSYNPIVMTEIHKIIDKWLDQDIIEKSFSPWRNPTIAVKKPDGSIRLCLDARKLNNVTKRDRLLTPNVFESLNSIPSDVKIFGRVDKNQAFLQTKLAESDKEKTAFFVKGRGLFQFKRMPFGLTNAPATQTRLMIEIFGDLSPYILVYFDDIIIMGKDYHHFIELLKIVAHRLRNNNLTISRHKMSLPLKSIKILGHVVTDKGITIDKNRVACIEHWPKPSCKKDLQRFIGFCNWYRRHIKDFSLISALLTDLTRKKIFFWTTEAEEAFEILKKKLLSPPLLKHPEWNRPMILLCDASNIGIGAALTQFNENNEECVIEFYSAKLNDYEKKYSPTEKECLAVIKSIKHFRSFIELSDLRIITDHYSLKYLLNMNITTGRLARWILFLQPYVNCIEHRAGKLMKVPDALSRAPIMLEDSDNTMENLFSVVKPFHEKNFQCNIIVDNQMLSKNSFQRNKNNDDWRLVPDQKIREQIISDAHEETLHAGIRTTLQKIKEKYSWKDARKDVKKFIGSCFKCASIKSSNTNLAGNMLNSRIPKNCLDIMSIDIKGPLPASGPQRYKYILVIMDLLSRLAWHKIYFSIKAHHVVNFLKTLFDNIGYPNSIIYDNGPQFISSKFQSFLESNNIKPHFIPVYTPKNNPVERFNRSLNEGLSLCLMDSPTQKRWTFFIDLVIEKLNNRKNEATKFSPVEVFYGYTPVNEEKPIRKMNANHVAIMEAAYSNSIQRFNENKKRYNRNKVSRKIEIGDIVMVKTHFLSKSIDHYNAKLDVKFVPAIILKIMFNNGYLVKLKDKREVIYDSSQIKQISMELQTILLESKFINMI